MKTALLLNPNTSQAMTKSLLAFARHTFGHSVAFTAITAARGVAVVASRASYAIASVSTLEAWAACDQRCDLVVVACFGDPGVTALRELLDIPVYGLAESAMRRAAADFERFAVVTAGLCWPPMLDELAAGWRIAGYLGTYAIDATGLSATGDPDVFRALMQHAIDTACAEGAQAIVLGGAALAGVAAHYRAPVPLLDCVELTLEAVAAGSHPPRAVVGPPPLACTGFGDAITRLLARRDTTHP